VNLDAYSSYMNVNLGAQTAQASPVQLMLILVNGLQDELARVKAHIQAGRYELKASSIDKCTAIINGMSSALDTEAGGAGWCSWPNCTTTACAVCTRRALL